MPERNPLGRAEEAGHAHRRRTDVRSFYRELRVFIRALQEEGALPRKLAAVCSLALEEKSIYEADCLVGLLRVLHSIAKRVPPLAPTRKEH